MTQDQIVSLLALLADLQAEKTRLNAEVASLQKQVAAALSGSEKPDGLV